MTDPKRLSDAACFVQMMECSVCDGDYTCPWCRFATEALARGRELKALEAENAALREDEANLRARLALVRTSGEGEE